MSERRRNRPLRAALIIALLAFFSNFLFFWQFAGEGILTWLGLILFVPALLLCFIALRRAFGHPELYRGKVSGPIATLVICLMFAGTIFAFYVSREIPEATQAPHDGETAPEFTLVDTSGTPVSLSSLLNAPLPQSPRPDGKPKAVLLVFYRGYW
jgi:hypothetical protein